MSLLRPLAAALGWRERPGRASEPLVRSALAGSPEVAGIEALEIGAPGSPHCLSVTIRPAANADPHAVAERVTDLLHEKLPECELRVFVVHAT